MRQFDLFGKPKIKNTIVPAMPYMGNKRKLATKLLNAMYNTIGDFQNFYDLFGGGGSMSVAALLAGHNVIYNELNTGVANLMRYIQAGGKLPEKWISREEFIQFKNNNDWYGGFIKCVWSFGNKQDNYLFGKDIEENKRLLHNVVVDKCKKSLIEINQKLKINIPQTIFDIANKTDRRMFLRQYIIEINKNYRGEAQLEQLERLEQLQQLEQLERLEIKNKSYDEIEIKNNSVIYCDIPYAGTTTYQITNFDYGLFYNWALTNNNPVFISEYAMPNEFLKIASFKHHSILSPTANNEVVENLFWNNKYI